MSWGLGVAGLAAGWHLAAPELPSGGSGSASGGRTAQSRRTIDFNRDVRPILAQHCFLCHGSDKEALKKTRNMRLDSFAGATADRGGYRAITPGKPDASMLWTRVTTDVRELRMPPADSGIKPLTEAEKKILRQWILEGAEYRRHWAFLPPRKPPLPSVSDPKWPKNEIDRFVLAGLDEEGLKPEPEADPATLARRAALTLTGLPLSPDETKAFLADRKPGAYERLVDRLLASPRYGEHQARYWLDAVRYADTHGLHIDNERAVFPYRDWVVRALNEDMPFDEFTIWQLAGDMLPESGTEQRIATGYVRMNPTTNEGGVIEAEFLAKNTFDRVETTATVYLGVTMTCARCHDHKYDPITQRDYYRMYAFFNNTADPPLDGNLKLHLPVMKAPTPVQEREHKALRRDLDAFEDAVDLHAARSWVEARYAVIPRPGSWEIAGPYAAKDYDTAFSTEFGPEKVGGNPTPAWKAIEIKPGSPKPALIGRDYAAAYLRTTFRVEKATDFAVRVGSDDGIRVWLNGELVHDNKALRPLAPDQDTVKLKLRSGENVLLVKIVNAAGNDGFAISYGDAFDARVQRAYELGRKGGLSSEERRLVASLYLEASEGSATGAKYRERLKSFRDLEASIPMTYVAEELRAPRPAYVLKRGEYDHPLERVYRGVPQALGHLPATFPQNRLGLAQWLVDPRNPLVSRVTVNRTWQQHFGTGIVETSEDFGNRGEWPSHPELLDYLAVRFREDGWSMKKLHRLIVTSAAFRQSSAADKSKWARDPGNRLLARGPRFRLDAEVIRDQALAVSGLLVEQPGGRGDKPYQPPGLWEIIAYPISDTARYVQDRGDALYRRSLYLFWKRTSPPPTMLIFDAPMRESCVVRRSRTNTPTQALVTMNETGFVEAARAMAERVLKSDAADGKRIESAFRIATGRSPTAPEKAVLLRTLADQMAVFAKSPGDAAKLLGVGEATRDRSLALTEHAAWTMVCNLILNLDEVLTQH